MNLDAKIIITSDIIINTLSEKTGTTANYTNTTQEEKYKDITSVLEAIDIRENSEHERYLKLYGVDVHDESNYDYVIDNTHYNILKEEVENILRSVQYV